MAYDQKGHIISRSEEPEEAMLENWQKLVSLLKKFVFFLRNSKLYDVKQNEKYPFAFEKVILPHFYPLNLRNAVVSLMMLFTSPDTDTNTMASHDTNANAVM